MTNKEKLKAIVFYCWMRGGADYTRDQIREFYDGIEKDLEVLNILKDCFEYDENGQWYIILNESDFDFKSELTQEEWNNSPQKKIKDWLKNDTPRT